MHSLFRRLLLVGILMSAYTGPAAAVPANGMPMRVLDRFDDITRWQVSASDDVRATLRQGRGTEGSALCLEFDFGAVSGYAVARRELALDYGENYEFSFGLRGDAPVNTLQFKLVDASGENVWWVNRPDYTFPREWQRVRFKRRHIAFAWGPAPDQRLRRSAALELVIVRGHGGGKGEVCFDALAFHELPPAAAERPRPKLHASSTLAPTQPTHALDGALDTVWRSQRGADDEPTLTLDFQQPREFGGLVLRWAPGAFASRYVIEYSDDGEHWRAMRRVSAGNGGEDPHWLPESETRYVRLRLLDGPATAYGLAEIEIKDLEWGASPNAFFQALATAAPRGHYPRAFAGEQSYWTVLGIDGGPAHGLLSEDGAFEIGPQSASVEPFLLTDEGLVTWADASVGQSLLEGYLPIPTVTWRAREWEMRVTAFAAGEHARSQLVSRYTLENHSDRSRVATLALAIRPFQVNPPTQFLNLAGGVAPIREMAWDGRALSLNGERRLYPLQPPDQIVIAGFDSGNIPELLAASRPRSYRLEDETGFASAVLLYRLELPPRGSRTLAVIAPLAGPPMVPAKEDDTTAWLDRQQAAIAASWREKLNRVTLQVPAAGRRVADTLRTALAHVLISRAGPALQPGTRAYARSWVRDGAMMADALSRLGNAGVARDYIEWFAPHQFSNGKVPCCVDARGSDPVAENDSHGALIYLVARHYRHTRDRAWLETMWPRVASAAAYMDALRIKERTPQNQTAERRAYYGLMPASISHEGYSDKPAYSYWDDFWALAGYDGAVEMAQVLGRDADAARLAAQRKEFSADLHASLRASITRHAIPYLPGSADRGDFDATSTTVALSIAGQQADLPQRELQNTFERYWIEFLARRDGTKWDVYTPYELRNVGAFVRLGWQKRAWGLLDFFLADRRPAGWNQWAEVVGRDARHPRFIGDMPHGWVASDFISAVLDLFAYERGSDQALVLAAGIPHDWLAGNGIRIENLRTPYGTVSYALRHDGSRLELKIEGGMAPPRGGLVFGWPYAGAPGPVFVNGHPARWEHGRELRILALPAVIAIETPRGKGN
jgi:hypothetical protein